MDKILRYFREVRTEFKNISWPKRDSLIQLTIVVISISVITSLILGGFDYLFTSSFGVLGNLKTQAPVQEIQLTEPTGFVLPSAATTPASEASPTAVKTN